MFDVLTVDTMQFLMMFFFGVDDFQWGGGGGRVWCGGVDWERLPGTDVVTVHARVKPEAEKQPPPREPRSACRDGCPRHRRGPCRVGTTNFAQYIHTWSALYSSQDGFEVQTLYAHAAMLTSMSSAAVFLHGA